MIDSKQFIIANTIFKKEDWIYMTLSCGKILSYHKELNICHNADNSVILLGHAWSVLPIEEQAPPSSFVENMNRTLTEEEIIQEEKTWCGRYVLIANDNIYLDTIGLLGIYYHQNAISSSINVLCQHLAIPVVFPDLKQGDQPPFLPGMMTGYKDILRLLPSQVLNIKSSIYHIRKLLPDETIKRDSLEEQVEKFSTTFSCSLNNMYQHLNNDNIMLALTGGRDSRALLAIISKTNIPYKLFSLEHDHISNGDLFIPSKLAKAINKQYLYIKRKNNFNLQLYNDFRTHCAGFAFDEDWKFYAYNQYQCLKKDYNKIVILRSGIWSIPSSYYFFTYNGSLNLKTIYPSLSKNKLHLQSAEQWLNYAQNDMINKDINIWDRMDWELDTTCWLAPIEQSLDIFDDIIFLQPANCRKIISLMYGFENRKNKYFEEQIANYLCPQFKDIPYDYQDGYIPKYVTILRKLKYNEEVFRGKIRDFVYGHIIKNGKK